MLNQPIQNSDVIHDTIPSYILLSFNKQINVFLHFPDFLRSFSFAAMNETRSCFLNIDHVVIKQTKEKFQKKIFIFQGERGRI